MVGTSHERCGVPCQDAGACRVLAIPGDNRQVLIAAVADGAGSAPRSAEGSSLAVRMFLSDFAAIVDGDPDLGSIGRADAVGWLLRLRREIGLVAAEAGSTSDEFACTFLGVVAGAGRTVLLQIGDGAIVVDRGDGGGHRAVFWPQHGEFANTTNFVTQDGFEAVLAFEVIERGVTELALFSDGIERLVLDMASETVHSPALSPIFRWLAEAAPDAGETGPSAGLSAYLRSARINERTDDDKTLVMAVRGADAGPE